MPEWCALKYRHCLAAYHGYPAGDLVSQVPIEPSLALFDDARHHVRLMHGKENGRLRKHSDLHNSDETASVFTGIAHHCAGSTMTRSHRVFGVNWIRQLRTPAVNHSTNDQLRLYEG